jgi:polyvinyl alcohol dehydrogenase (cytochrome)
VRRTLYLAGTALVAASVGFAGGQASAQQVGQAQSLARQSGEQSGAAIYAARCARCHDAPETRAPSKATLAQMASSRILRSMDFGLMMSVTYMLDRGERETVADYLGVSGEERALPSGAYCADRAAAIPRTPQSAWNGWSPAPTNTRFQPVPGFAAGDVPRLELNWAFAFDGDVNAFAPPAVFGDQLFVGSAGGMVYALDAERGCVQWQYQADGPVRTAIVVAALDSARPSARHAAFFGDQSGGFYAVSAETGALLWRDRPEAHEATKLTGAPLAYDGVVYVPVASWEESRPLNPEYACCTFRGSIVAYRIADGKRLWKSFLVLEEPKRVGETEAGVPILSPSGAGTWSAPTLDAERGRLYVTTGNNYTGQTPYSDAVVALALEDGRIAWSQQLTPGDEFNLYCRARDGCPGMDSDFGSSAVLEKLADGRERLVVGQKSGIVYGLDPADDGALVWQTRVGEGGINGGVLWGMASDGRNVYAAVSDLGRRAQTDRDAFDPRPTGVDPAKGGGLSALDLVTGERVWYAPPSICDPDQPVCSPAQPAAVSAIEGVVFSGAVDGHLRAFATADGRVIWDYDTAREFETVNGVPGRGGSIDGDGAVIAGGRVFITSGYGRNGGMPGNVLLAFGAR